MLSKLQVRRRRRYIVALLLLPKWPYNASLWMLVDESRVYTSCTTGGDIANSNRATVCCATAAAAQRPMRDIAYNLCLLGNEGVLF